MPTDPGLGPKSPPADESGARPAPKEESKKYDSTEAVLEGFGAHRPDRPRVKPVEATPTPPPPEVTRHKVPALISTSPGQRQIQNRKRALYLLVLLLCICGAIFIAMKATQGPEESKTAPTATTTPVAMTTADPTTTVPPIPTYDTTSLPTATTATTAKSIVKPPTTVKSSAPSATAPAVTTAPTSSGPDPKNDVKRTM